MSSVQAPGGSPNRDGDKDKAGKDGKDSSSRKQDGDAEMKDAEPEEDILDDEILSLNTQDILTRRRLLENDSRIMKSEYQRLSHEKATMGEKIKENQEKIANNRYGLLIRLVWAVAYMLMLPSIDNSPTLSATSSSCSISIRPPNPSRKELTSTSTRYERASRPSSRPPPAKQSSSR